MKIEVESGDLALSAYLARPTEGGRYAVPAVVLCHGFPDDAGGGAGVNASYPELADRMAREMEWVVLTVANRGCGDSQGDFSLGGWLADVGAAVQAVAELERVNGIWLAGFGTGGALAICAATADDRVRGVASLGAPADFLDWAEHPDELLDYARLLGVIRSQKFPADKNAWAAELASIRAVDCAAKLAPRPLLVIHGSGDDAVSDWDARLLADVHAKADLRIINGAGHALRYDPRSIATLLGWLNRQRNRYAPTKASRT